MKTPWGLGDRFFSTNYTKSTKGMIKSNKVLTSSRCDTSWGCFVAELIVRLVHFVAGLWLASEGLIVSDFVQLLLDLLVGMVMIRYVQRQAVACGMTPGYALTLWSLWHLDSRTQLIFNLYYPYWEFRRRGIPGNLETNRKASHSCKAH